MSSAAFQVNLKVRPFLFYCFSFYPPPITIFLRVAICHFSTFCQHIQPIVVTKCPRDVSVGRIRDCYFSYWGLENYLFRRNEAALVPMIPAVRLSPILEIPFVIALPESELYKMNKIAVNFCIFKVSIKYFSSVGVNTRHKCFVSKYIR